VVEKNLENKGPFQDKIILLDGIRKQGPKMGSTPKESLEWAWNMISL
jgi:hypothetical protein